MVDEPQMRALIWLFLVGIALRFGVGCSEFSGCEGTCGPLGGGGSSAASGGNGGSSTAGTSSGDSGSGAGGQVKGQGGGSGNAGGGTGGNENGAGGLAGEHVIAAGTSGAAGESEGGEAGDGGAGGQTPILTNVRVLGLEDLQPVQGAWVLVSDSTGALLSSTETDSAGSVTVEVPTGAGVSAALIKNVLSDGKFVTISELQTIFPPEAGTTIQLIVSDPSDSGAPVAPPVMSFTLTLPELPAGATRWKLQLGNRSVTTQSSTWTTEISVDGSETTFDVYAFAVTDAFDLVAWASHLDEDFVPGGTVSVSLLPTDANMARSQLHVGGIPPGSELVTFSMTGFRDGRDRGPSLFVNLSAPSTDETLAVGFPAVGLVRFETRGSLQFSSKPLRSGAAFVRTGAEVLAESNWLPFEDLATFDPTASVDTSDLKRFRMSWTLREQGPLGDVVVANLTWGEQPSLKDWKVLLPPTRELAVRLPELPDELDELRPQSGETPAFRVTHFDLAETVGYMETLERYSVFDIISSHGNVNYSELRE